MLNICVHTWQFLLNTLSWVYEPVCKFLSHNLLEPLRKVHERIDRHVIHKIRQTDWQTDIREWCFVYGSSPYGSLCFDRIQQFRGDSYFSSICIYWSCIFFEFNDLLSLRWNYLCLLSIQSSSRSEKDDPIKNC